MDLLSIDQAASALEPETAAAPVVEEAAAPAATETVGDDDQVDAVEAETTEDDAAAEVADDAGEEEAEVEAVAIQAPTTWNAEDKEIFASYPPEVQAKVLEQEAKREASLQKTKVKAAEAARTEAKAEVEAEVATIRQIAAKAKEVLPKALKAFRSHWGGEEFDFAVYQQHYGTDEALRLQRQFQSEQKALEQSLKVVADAEAAEAAETAQRELSKLSTLVPELVDPNGAHRQKLASYMRGEGLNPDGLASAAEAQVVWKAMKYDEAQAAAKARKAPPKPAPPPVKPAAAQAHSPQQRTATALQARLRKSGRIEDAVALLDAKGL